MTTTPSHDRLRPLTHAEALTRVADDLGALHAQKRRAYGSSWRRHGEYLSIFPNIARKADRLALNTATADEQPTDTVADLAVYCLLYASWLRGHLHLDDEGVALEAERCVQLARTSVRIALHRVTFDSICAPYHLLEDRLLLAISQGARRSDDRDAKLALVDQIAALAIEWLALLAIEKPASYAAWARQWTEADHD